MMRLMVTGGQGILDKSVRTANTVTRCYPDNKVGILSVKTALCMVNFNMLLKGRQHSASSTIVLLHLLFNWLSGYAGTLVLLEDWKTWENIF
jgi:hypothetical protein